MLASPAGIALVGKLLFIANQDGDELHVFDTQIRNFRSSPNLMFPLSVPTVRRPGPVCGNASQVFTASTVDATFGVIDARDDVSVNDPVRGLRELGEGVLPGLASDGICTQAPEAVLAHKVAAAGSAAAYQQALGVTLTIDAPGGLLPGGGLDERHALASLPIAALFPINGLGGPCAGSNCAGTQIWQVTNDLSGVSCDAGAPAFCPNVKPLLSLPPQPASCHPRGPPLALRVDASGANAGLSILGAPNADPTTANRLMASDRNSSCVASVNLDDLSVQWLPANFPSTSIFAAPFIPGSCLPGGDLFAALRDSENCELEGPPPSGGYFDCNGVSFLSASAGALLPEPLPYPFTPRRPLPPVRIIGSIATQLTYLGPNLQVSWQNADLPSPVPIQELAVVGTAGGDMVFIDVGVGSVDGGSGSSGSGFFPCPVTQLAPRLLDQNDYLQHPITPQVFLVSALDSAGGSSLGAAVLLTAPPSVVTASGTPVPTFDRLDAGFSTVLGIANVPLPTVSCYGLPSGSQICLTAGMLQKGVAEDEAYAATYEGAIGGLAGVAGTLTGNSLQLAGLDATQVAGGLLLRESGNVTIELTSGGGVCGDYGLSAVAAAGLTLSPSPHTSCASGPVSATFFASGAKPFTLTGTGSGFFPALWSTDGTLQLVPGHRWHYPANLIAMVRGAQQLADLVFSPLPDVLAAGSSLAAPRADGHDSDALDAPFAMAFVGPLGSALDGGVDAGVLPQRGASWTFSTSSAVLPLAVNPIDGSSLIDGMAAYIDLVDGGTPHLYGSYRGGNALIEIDPRDAYSPSILEIH